MGGLNTGVAGAALKDRGNDLYESPPEAVHALLGVEDIPAVVWEPACGPGSIVRVLRASGRQVYATDLVDYQSPDQDVAGWDFLLERQAPIGVQAIVTTTRQPRRTKPNRAGPCITSPYLPHHTAHELTTT